MARKPRKPARTGRRDRGSGSISQQGPNRWRIRTPRTQGQPVRSETVTGARAAARARLDELIAEQAERAGLGARDLTVATWLAEWLEQIQRTRAKATHASYAAAVNGWIVPELGQVLLIELNAAHCQRWLRTLDRAGQRTAQNAVKVFKRALAVAVQQQLIRVNPMAAIEAPRVDRHQPEPFSAEQVRLICSECDGSPWALFIRLGFATGMRQGELLGLQWGDLDTLARVLHVRRQVVEVSGRQSITELKTDSSRRPVPIGDELIDQLLTRRRAAMSYGQAGDRCHVFARSNGRVPQRSNFGQRHWRQLLERLGIRHRGFHHVRHTWAAHQLSAGTPITMVSRILGHSKVSTTLDVYARWLPEDLDRARAAIDRLMG